MKDYVTKKVDEILCKPSGVLSDELADMVDRTRDKTPQMGNERSSEGSMDQTTNGEQEDSSQNSLVIQGLTPDKLAKFVMATMVVAGAPQAQIGLQGIDLTWAIFQALPGFLRTINGGWNPAGL